MADIVVFGATGFTGRLIAQQLYEGGFAFALAGRDEAALHLLSDKLGHAPVLIADAAKPRTLDNLMAGTRVLINTVGPFLRYGEPVVNAAVESGVHYVDTTGEQTYMKRIVNRYDGVAQRNGVTVINGLAFEYAVGDWLAALAAERLGDGGMIDSISVGYSLSGGGVSRGTALSIFEMMGEQGWSYEGGRWRRRPMGWTTRAFRFPQGERQVLWMPFGETITVPRHHRVQTVLTYYRFPKVVARVLPLVAAAGSIARQGGRTFASRVIARRAAGPSDAVRYESRFSLAAEALRGGEVQRATATGRDPYGLTARIVMLGVETLLNDSVQRGVRAPAHLPFPPGEALARVGVAEVR